MLGDADDEGCEGQAVEAALEHLGQSSGLPDHSRWELFSSSDRLLDACNRVYCPG